MSTSAGPSPKWSQTCGRQMEHVYRRVLETGEPATNIEVERQTHGEPDFRHWLASYYPVRVDGEMLGVGVIVTDITERQEAEHFRAAVMDTMVEGLYALDDAGPPDVYELGSFKAPRLERGGTAWEADARRHPFPACGRIATPGAMNVSC